MPNSNSTEGSRPLSAEDVLARQKAALEEVYALCKGEHRAGGKDWVMSIPVQPWDSDMVLSASLRDIPILVAENERLAAGHELHLSKIAELREDLRQLQARAAQTGMENERLEAQVKESNTLTDTLREQVRLLVESCSIAEYERLVTQVESMRAVVEAADRYESVEVSALVAPIYEELEAAVKAYRAQQERSQAESEAGTGEGESNSG